MIAQPGFIWFRVQWDDGGLTVYGVCSDPDLLPEEERPLWFQMKYGDARAIQRLAEELISLRARNLGYQDW